MKEILGTTSKPLIRLLTGTSRCSLLATMFPKQEKGGGVVVKSAHNMFICSLFGACILKLS